MLIKDLYELVIEKIARKPIGTFNIYEDFENFPYELIQDKKKVVYISKPQTIGWELNDNATDEDYKTYIDYVLRYTETNIDDLLMPKKSFSKFKK